MMENEIVEYGITDAALEELKGKFSLVPDPGTEQGYADIKCNLKVIQPYLKKLEDKRVELKADSLARGRLIDSEAKRIKGVLLEIRDPLKLAKQKRDDELKAIEQAKADAEAAHIAAIEQKVTDINNMVEGLLGADSKTIQARLDAAKNIVISNVEFEDSIEQAKESKDRVIDELESAVIERKAFEVQWAEQEERQRIQDEKQSELDAKQAVIDKQEAEQRQKEHDARIAKEAEERATMAAELAQQKERDATEERERQLRDSIEKAERDSRETEARVKAEQAAKIKREHEEAEKREANKKHKAIINNEAVKNLVNNGMNETNAKKAVTLIAKRLIPNVIINY